MSAPVEELQRIGLKLFAADGTSIRAQTLVPVFHRWIQSRAVAGHLLIDVADYEHVPDGPGVVLVAHEGNFSLDCGGGRLGLAYTRKTALPGRLAERLHAIARSALLACCRLEDETAIRFRGDRLQVFANDRLRAPNTPETLAALRPSLLDLLHTLYGDVDLTLTRESDPQERLGVQVEAPAAVDIRTLLQRVR
jgi:hypothetical protein